MTFYPPKIIRFCYRYLLIGVLVVLPIVCLILALDEKFTKPEDILYPIISCSLLAIFNFAVIQISFWEKMFSRITIKDDRVEWKCPLRKNRILPMEECVEIGAFLEHENKGIPTEEIYFSNQKNLDLPNIRRVMHKNRKIIVFWYSEELYRYIRQTADSQVTSRLVAYRTQKRRKNV